MPLTLTADPLPLHADAHGSIRVGATRVLLEFVLHAYQAGATPEQIVQRFDTLDLADVHAVIAYYLRHRQDVEDYLVRREAEAQDTRRRLEADHPPRVTRDELLARWSNREAR
jgi:uncharacterized protein (DUF433 family)